MYSEKHYQIYNHINIKLLKENNAGEQKVQNLNTKNILVTKEKK